MTVTTYICVHVCLCVYVRICKWNLHAYARNQINVHDSLQSLAQSLCKYKSLYLFSLAFTLSYISFKCFKWQLFYRPRPIAPIFTHAVEAEPKSDAMRKVLTLKQSSPGQKSHFPFFFLEPVTFFSSQSKRCSWTHTTSNSSYSTVFNSSSNHNENNYKVLLIIITHLIIWLSYDRL